MTFEEQLLLAFVTACLTLLGGCFLFFLTGLLIKPYLAYKSTLGEATFKLIFYANYIFASVPTPETTKEDADPPAGQILSRHHFVSSRGYYEYRTERGTLRTM